MIRPRFNIAQDDDSVTITVRAPYGDLKACHVDFEGTSFLFTCAPYFLRLNLPGEIVDSDAYRASFDADTQEFTFRIDKKTKGERFVDLDMITKLLLPAKSRAPRPTIEVISSSDNPAAEDDDTDEPVEAGGNEPERDDDGADIDSDDVEDEDRWCFEQPIDESNVDDLVFSVDRLKICPNDSGYGFAEKRTGFLDGDAFEFSGLLDNINIPNVSQTDRRKMMNEYIKTTFDPKYYVNEIYDEYVDSLVSAESPLATIEPESVVFGPEELDALKDFPNREYLIDEFESVYLGLVDILFAYCYDMRCWSFEPNVESAWAYNRISPTLSAFVRHENLYRCVLDCFRRALTLPLYRNLRLCKAALGDVKALLALGKKKVVRSLLEIYNAFNSSGSSAPRYILNELYIKDYIIFVQKCEYARLDEMREEIGLMLAGETIKPDDLDLNLNELEGRLFLEMLHETSDDTDDSSDDTESDDSSDDTESDDA